MSGIISITSRRLPRNVFSLGMQAARSQEVKSANVVHQYARLATVQAQLFGESQVGITADGDTVKAGQDLFKVEKAEGGAAPAPAAKSATPPPPAAAPTPPPPAAKPAAAPEPPRPVAPCPPPPAATAASISVSSIPLRAPGVVPPQVKLKEVQNVNAMLTTFNAIDMSSAMAFRKQNLEAFQKKFGIKMGFMSIFAKAAAYA